MNSICRPLEARDGSVGRPDACVGSRCADGGAEIGKRDDDESPGSAPIECRFNADCEEQGLPSGLCVDNVCFAAGEETACSADDECADIGVEYVGGRCVKNQCRPNPRWRCETPTTVTEPGDLTLDVFVRDSLTLDPITDVRALVCQKLDVSCTEPVATVMAGRDGHLVFTVRSDFQGYLQLESKRYAAAIYQLPPVFPADGKLQPAPLLSAGLIDSLAETLGAKLDPTRGNMMLVAEDCQGQSLPGIVFEAKGADTKTVPLYVRDLLPTRDVQETDRIGNGGFLNFPAGNAVINTVIKETSLRLATVSLLVRPGFITVAYIRPELR